MKLAGASASEMYPAAPEFGYMLGLQRQRLFWTFWKIKLSLARELAPRRIYDVLEHVEVGALLALIALFV